MSNTHKKIISFDVGIKNMAYCIFEVDSQTTNIIDWNVVNLMDTPPPTYPKCSLCARNKSEPINSAVSVTSSLPQQSLCKTREKKAKYEKDGQYYCENHAKKTDFLMPTKPTYPAFLKKHKIGELHKIALAYNMETVSIGDKRADIIKKILDYFDKRALKLVVLEKKSANKESLITIARNIRDKFDAIDTLEGVTDVLIENQIFTIAARMSSIQGLLTQYFTMRYDSQEAPINIEFISSKNKLKNYEKAGTKTDGDDDAPASGTNQKYKQNKMDSIVYTRQLMEKYPDFARWESVLESTKKDDLADCFLQGIWYLQTQKLLEP